MEAANNGFHFFAYPVIAQITDGAFMGCPAEGGFPRTSHIKIQFVRQKVGFHGQVIQNQQLVLY